MTEFPRGKFTENVRVDPRPIKFLLLNNKLGAQKRTNRNIQSTFTEGQHRGTKRTTCKTDEYG